MPQLNSTTLSNLVHRLTVLFVVFNLMLGQATPVSAQGGKPPTQTPTPVVTPSGTPDPSTGSTGSPQAGSGQIVTPTETPAPIETTVISSPLGTPTPILGTSTPDVSTPDTSTPDASTPTVTATAAPQYALEISSHPGFLTKSRVVNLEWTITGMTEGQTGLTLAVTLPEGYEPKDSKKSNETFDPATGVYVFPVSDAQGKVQIRATKVKTDVVISATLFSGAEILTGDSLILPVHQQFDVNAGGGEINGHEGKIKVTFPSGALAEDVEVNMGFPTDDLLPKHGFSDKVFELKAHAKSDVSTGLDSREISHFDVPLTIEVDYSDMALSTEDENNLYLYWYNEETGDWNGLPSIADKEAKVLRATTDHFTIFDVGVNNWKAEQLPTVESWQVAQFTGAGTYSLPLQVPEGAGGFKPNVTLSYNSQIVDEATTVTQASWVGMGWSMDGGGSISVTGDGYSLNVNGVSTRLLVGFASFNDIDKSGTHTATAVDENFWKITHEDNLYGKPISWKVYDKQGTVYYFDTPAKTVCYCGPQEEFTHATYAWHLTSATNTSGQQLTYEYDVQSKNVPGAVNGAVVYKAVNTAVYLKTITYPGNTYRVRFERELRDDYTSAYDTDATFHPYQKERLKAVYMEQDSAHNGTFSTIVRQYVFTYTGSSQIWPGFTTSKGGKTLTLQKVEEFGEGGATALPAQTFTYDALHLTSADNGYGGVVTYTYESDPYYSTVIPQPTDYDLSNPNEAAQYNLINTDTKSWKTCSGGADSIVINGWHGGLGCLTSWYWVTNKSAYNSYRMEKMARPGGKYAVVLGAAAIVAGSTYKIGVRGGSAAPQIDAPNSPNTYTVTLTTSANGLSIYMTAVGSVKFTNAILVKYATYYRVKEKTVDDGSGLCGTQNEIPTHCYKSTYTYTGPLVGTKDFEYRGNASVIETAPDGTKTTSYFHQDDVKKGRAWKVEVQDPDGQTRSMTESTYVSIPYTTPSNQFTHAWVYLESQVNHIYNASGVEVGATRTEYTYDENTLSHGTVNPLAGHYGNLLEQREYSGATNANLYRKTVIEYHSNTSAYIVSAPAHETVYDSTNQMIAETQNFYDSAGSFTTPPAMGLLTSTKKLISGSNYAQTDYGYDEYSVEVEGRQVQVYGNQTSVKTYSKYNDTGPGSMQETRTDYDLVYHTRPLTITNPKGHITEFRYDDVLGLPNWMKDANGQIITAAYDSFGRVASVARALPADSASTLTMTYSNGYPFTTSVKLSGADVNYTVTNIYDGIGREMRSTADGVTTTTETWTSMPGDQTQFTKTVVNLNAHTTTTTAPDGTFTTSATNGLISTVTDAKGNATTTTNDILGRVLNVTPPTGPAVTYEYNSLDQLVTVSRGGATTSMTYDLAGRKFPMSDADMGNWFYDYDAIGNLVYQKDARNCITHLTYDALNRPTAKTYADCPATSSVTYGYDAGINGVGRRTSMSSGDTSSSWTYDIRGRVESETAMGYTTHYGYNSADLMTSMTYPGGETVTYGYNSEMLLKSVTGNNSYVLSTGYDDAGRITSRALGNGLTQKYGYNAWNVQGGRLQNLTTGVWDANTSTFTSKIQNLDYGYDSVGNITGITNPIASENQSYAYDALDRLTGWTLNGATENYGYDSATGNLSNKAGTAYTYDSTHKHAVASLSNGNTYDYDANGNQTVRHIGSDTFNLSYDAENRLVEVKKNNSVIAQFVYDGDGKRVKSVEDGKTTLFVSNGFEVNVTTGEVSKYYFAGAQRIAVRKYIIPQTTELNYLLSDHLGSTSLVTSDSGSLISETRYKAWGEVRYATSTRSSLPVRYTYTSQFSYMDDPITPESEGFGLMFYNARWMDPYLNHFTQPDSIVPDPYNPQDWDRFSYARNNPLKYIDPTGHDPWWCDTADCESKYNRNDHKITEVGSFKSGVYIPSYGEKAEESWTGGIGTTGQVSGVAPNLPLLSQAPTIPELDLAGPAADWDSTLAPSTSTDDVFLYMGYTKGANGTTVDSYYAYNESGVQIHITGIHFASKSFGMPTSDYSFSCDNCIKPDSAYVATIKPRSNQSGGLYGTNANPTNLFGNGTVNIKFNFFDPSSSSNPFIQLSITITIP